MANLIKYFKIIISEILRVFDGYPDPVYECDLYKAKGCSHVDGFLCDFPECSMNNDYKKL